MICTNRQYSTESQQSASYVHSNSMKEKETPKPNNIGEKLIEVEKTETGSVSYIGYYYDTIFSKDLHMEQIYFSRRKVSFTSILYIIYIYHYIYYYLHLILIKFFEKTSKQIQNFSKYNAIIFFDIMKVPNIVFTEVFIELI